MTPKWSRWPVWPPWRRIRRAQLKRPEIDHLSLRLLALFLAIVLWFLATDQPQPSIGAEQRSVNVETQVESVGERLVVTEPPPAVNLTLEGPRLVLSFQAGDARAYVDAAGLGPGRHRVPVEARAPSGLTVRAINPAEVELVLEEEIAKSVPVRAAVLGTGEGVSVRIEGVEPAEMIVYGVESAISRTAYIMAQVDPASPSDRVRAIPVDQQGTAVAGVAPLHEWVKVNFTVEKNTSGR